MKSTKSDDGSKNYEWFLIPARKHFKFLIDGYNFEEYHNPTLNYPEVSLYYVKNAMAICPEVDGTLISVGIQKIDSNIGVKYGYGHEIYMLERLRCSNERFNAEERNLHTYDTPHEAVDRVFAHDADILKRYFPDVLAGRFDFIKCETLPIGWDK